MCALRRACARDFLHSVKLRQKLSIYSASNTSVKKVFTLKLFFREIRGLCFKDIATKCNATNYEFGGGFTLKFYFMKKASVEARRNFLLFIQTKPGDKPPGFVSLTEIYVSWF